MGRKLSYLLLLAFASCLTSLNILSQTTISSVQTGAWLDGSTWVGGAVPGTTDDAVVKSGHTVSLATGAGETIHALTIEAGAVLDARNKTMTVTGKMIVDGTYTSDDNSAKDLIFSGDSMGGGGTIAVKFHHVVEGSSSLFVK